MNRIDQDSFVKAKFDASRLNLHRHPGDTGQRLTIFLHGLGGSGYGTWGDLPKYIFEYSAHDDVLVCDYFSGLRSFMPHRRSVTSRKMLEHLSQYLLNQIGQYEEVFLVGHSLGGVLCERICMEVVGPMAGQLTTIAGIFVFGAPRGGAGLASTSLTRVFPNLRIIKPNGEFVSANDKFFSGTRAIDRLTDDVSAEQVLLPRFAISGDDDHWVGRMSSAQSIPDEQRIYLPGTHTKIVKPDSDRDDIVRTVRERCDAVSARRLQLRRERSYQLRRNSRQQPMLLNSHIVADYWTPEDKSTWQHSFWRAVESADTSPYEVVAWRDGSPDVLPDILVSMLDAENVLVEYSPDRNRISRARARSQTDASLLVAVTPIGSRATEAKDTIIGWYLNSLEAEWVVEPSRNLAELEQHISRWLSDIAARRRPLRLHQVGGNGLGYDID